MDGGAPVHAPPPQSSNEKRQRAGNWRSNEGPRAAPSTPPSTQQGRRTSQTPPPSPPHPSSPPQYLGDVPLAGGAETSAEYSIPFPRQLPPREFMLQVKLFYTTAAGLQTKLFFNETIQVIEEPTLFDTQLLGLYLMGAALLAAICEWRGGAWVRGLGASRVWAEAPLLASERGLAAGRGPGESPALRPAAGCAPHGPLPPAAPALQSTPAPSSPGARAGSRRASLWPGQVRRLCWCCRAAFSPSHADLGNVVPLQSNAPPCALLLLPAAAASTNKDEWLRGTAADPKLRKKQ